MGAGRTLALIALVGCGSRHAELAGEPRARPASMTVTPAPALPPADQRLEGIALDVREQPVAHATIVLGDRVAVTGDDGGFAFDGVDGIARVTAEAGELYGEETGSTRELVMIEMRARPSVVLHVVDDAGGPIEGARASTAARRATTDATGQARLRGIGAPLEIITVDADGRAPAVIAVETEAGSTATLERTVTLRAGAPVEGVVLDPDGHPVAQARVELALEGDLFGTSVETDADGRWRVERIAAGTHAVHAIAERFVAMPEQPFEHDGVHARQGLVVRVGAGGEIAGVVVDDAGAPVAGATVRGYWIRTTTDAQGRFVAAGLGAGAYRLVATTPAGAMRDLEVVVPHAGHVDVRLVVPR